MSTLRVGQVDRRRTTVEFMSIVGIRDQALELQQSRSPDSNIESGYVSDIGRHNLKESFQSLSNEQKFLRFRYPRPNR